MRTSTARSVAPSVGSAWIVLAAALMALLGVRVLALHYNATELFFDEAQYWSWSKEPAFGYYSKPPLVAWLIGLAGQVCGDRTFCIRLPAPVIHTASAIVVFLIGRRLHDERVGLWAGITFATLPGISFSSGIISTDVPLLFAWALALWAYIAMREDDGWLPALLLGAAIGVGLNAKYAMVFFLASMAVHMAVTPAARRLLKDARLWTALVIGAALIAPNMLWNLSNSFATFAHTADNAKWGGSLVNVGKGLEFVGAQFGVFGPVLFGVLVVTVWRAWTQGLPEGDRLLLAFTLPVLLAISAQAFASRAHANWAATAYVAGSVLVPAVLIRRAEEHWLRYSLALHIVVLAVMIGATTAAGRFTIPGMGDPFARTLGWEAVADATRRKLDERRNSPKPFRAVISDERAVTAELLYYMRGEPTPILAWRDSGRPKDHYELTRPYTDASQAPVLLVALRSDTDRILRRFTTVELLVEEALPSGLGPPRRIRFYALSGLKPE